MPLPTKIAPDATAAPRPAVAKKKSRLRLLVPCGDRLPPGVLSRLKRSPIEVVAVHPTLSGLTLRRSDVVLLGDASRLGELAAALRSHEALSTPVVAIGPDNGSDHGLRLKRVVTATTPEGTADTVLRTVVKLLKPLGLARPTRSAAPHSRQTPVRDETSVSTVGPTDKSANAELPAAATLSMATNPLAAKPLAAKPLLAKPSAVKPAPLPAPANDAELESPAPVEFPRSAPLPIFAVGTPTRTSLTPDKPLALGTDPVVSARLSHSLMPESFSIQGSRWIVLDDEVARAHATASCLSALGGVVEVSSGHPSDRRLAVLRSFDAVGLLVADASLEQMGPLLGVFQRDARLRWVRVVPVRFSELYDERSSRLDEEKLKLLLLPHWQVEHDTVRDLLASRSVPIDHVGPAKLLRAGARLRGKMDLSIESGGRLWDLTLGEGQVLRMVHDGVTATAAQLTPWLEQMLSLGTGTARLGRNRQLDEARPIDAVEDLLDRCTHPGMAPVHAPSASSRGLGVPAAAALDPVVAEQAVAPDPRYDDDVLTVPLDRNELVRQGYVPEAPFGLPASSGGGRLARAAQRTRLELTRAYRFTQVNVLAPARLRARAAYAVARPWVLTHKPLSIGAGSLLLGSVVVLAVLLARTGSETARADVEQARTGQPATPKTTAAATPEQATAAAPEGDAQEQEQEQEQEPPGPTDIAAVLQAPKERPAGCERWVGSEPIARRAKQAKSAWRMARKSLMRGDMQQAEQRLCLSVQLDPHGPGTADLIRFQLQNGDIESAKTWAKWAAQERPEDPEPEQLLADALHLEGNVPMARALLLDSMNVTAADMAVVKSVANKYANVGFRALNGADPAQADRLFRRATTLDPKHPLATAGRAAIALGTGDVAAAVRFAERSVEFDPKLFEGHLVLGDAFAKQGKANKARTEWLTAAALKPGTREARDRLGL